MADTVLLESPQKLFCHCGSHLSPLAISWELLWPFPRKNQVCARDSCDTVAYDDSFGTVTMFSRARVQRKLRWS